MTTGDDVVAALREAGCVFAEDEAAVLRSSAAGPADLAAMVARRVTGLPLEHVVGWAELGGVRVAVDVGVFVPRRRSELLAREATALLTRGATVVDLCCGSGALGAVLLAAEPTIELHAADLDPVAVACARRNVPTAHHGDLYDALPLALRGRVDLLVVNAPYVPTGDLPLLPTEAREHEPPLALDGGADGRAVQRRVAAGATEWLARTGILLIETSDRQADGTARDLAAAGLTVRLVRDEELGAVVAIGVPD